MAPNCIATVNIFTKLSEAIPINAEAIIMCPVDEMGKNSVKPSIIARIMACKLLIQLS
jgi:hypothetical protein